MAWLPEFSFRQECRFAQEGQNPELSMQIQATWQICNSISMKSRSADKRCGTAPTPMVPEQLNWGIFEPQRVA
jgi:hypothetical protein